MKNKYFNFEISFLYFSFSLVFASSINFIVAKSEKLWFFSSKIDLTTIGFLA
jgi:hypothetical protein